MYSSPATMKLLFTLFLLVQITRAAVKGPPTASHHRSKQIVLVGSNVRLQCPMSGHPNPMIDWTKDKEGIIDYSWTRFEASKKVLKISRAQLEDTGIYRCKGNRSWVPPDFDHLCCASRCPLDRHRHRVCVQAPPKVRLRRIRSCQHLPVHIFKPRRSE